MRLARLSKRQRRWAETLLLHVSSRHTERAPNEAHDPCWQWHAAMPVSQNPDMFILRVPHFAKVAVSPGRHALRWNFRS